MTTMSGSSRVDETARAHLFLSGTVQGVGMRMRVRTLANRFALAGWVKNLRDGRVEAIVEGLRRDVEQAISRIPQGGYEAYIRHVEIAWEEPTGEFRGFEIAF